MTTQMKRWTGLSWVPLYGLTENNDGSVVLTGPLTVQVAGIATDTADSTVARFGHASAAGTTGFRQKNTGVLTLAGPNAQGISLLQRNSGDTGYDTIASFAAASSSFNGASFAAARSSISGMVVGDHPIHGATWDGLWGNWSQVNFNNQDYAVLVGADAANQGKTLFNAWAEMNLRVANVTKMRMLPGGIFADTHLTVAGTLTMTGTNVGPYWADYGGGWRMTDTTWLRSYGDKSVWLGGGHYGTNGSLFVGYGGLGDGAYKVDVNGGTSRFGHIVTYSGYRFTSNGGQDGWYYNASFLAQKSGDRASYGIHPGGVAFNMGATSSSPGVAFWTLDSASTCGIYAASFNISSSRKVKENIRPWPLKSVGAGVINASDRLALIEVMQFQLPKEGALAQAMPERREKALVRLNSMMAAKGAPLYVRDLHACDPSDCGGSAERPCRRMTAYENPHIGPVVEDLALVLPEAVEVDDDGEPATLRLGSAVGFLFAVCKEQQVRIEALEAAKSITK